MSEVFRFVLEKIDNLPFVNQHNAFQLLVSMHMAGALGLAFDGTREIFMMLTPYNLLATGLIVFHFEAHKSWKYGLFLSIAFLTGFFIEVLGVHTGVIFGNYYYGDTLGFKLFDVPLAIGLNWAILIYASGQLSRRITKHPALRILLGAAMLTILDYLIEPVALTLNFWNWVDFAIPTQNYLAWFLVSAFLHLVYELIMTKSDNSLAVRLLYIQAAFFLILNFI